MNPPTPGRLAAIVGLLASIIIATGCRCAGEETAAGRPSGAPPDDREAKSGYGSDVSTDNFALGVEEKRALLRLARESVERLVREGREASAPQDLAGRFPTLAEPRACFVTLRVGEALRGCIGTLEPRRSLIEDVRQNATAAAVHDTRFAPVRPDELESLSYSISVLDLPRPLEGVSADALPEFLAKHRPGVIIELRGRRSTFLPSVWEDLPDPVEFMSRLCRKQGSDALCWRDPAVRISTYSSIYFSEKDVR
jgi:hypothetical protein